MTFLGAANTQYMQNLVYHKLAFTLAMVDLVMPHSGEYSRVFDPGSGVSMRSWKDSNINTDSHPARVDILGGWGTPVPEAAVRFGACQRSKRCPAANVRRGGLAGGKHRAMTIHGAPQGAVWKKSILTQQNGLGGFTM